MRALSQLRQGIKYSSLAVDRLRPPQGGISILIYHRVGLGAGGQMDLNPSVFRDQMHELRETHRVLTLGAAIDELTSNLPVEPGVVVTFDDGTADWLENVVPTLVDTGVPATFYISTDFVDRRVPFPQDGTPMTWNAVEELASVPLATIGAHTHTHKLLDRLDPDELNDELDTSNHLLAEHTGAIPEHFAYPKAVPPSPQAHRAVSQRYSSAVLAGTRSNPAGTDPYLLSRSPIQPSDGPRFFTAKARGGLGLEDTIRRTVNTIRYRGIDS